MKLQAKNASNCKYKKALHITKVSVLNLGVVG